MVPLGIDLRSFERAAEALWLAAELRSVMQHGPISVRQLAVLIAVLAFVLVRSTFSAATDFLCDERTSEYMVEYSDLVFLGRLVSETKASEKSNRRVSTLAILQRWKGPNLTKTVDIVWWGEGLFLADVTYLVYALQDPSGFWHVQSNACGFRVLFGEKADTHLQDLGAPVWEYNTPSGDEPTTLQNKTLQTNEIRTSRSRKSAAHVLFALRAEAVGGSCRLAKTSDILVETL